MRFADQILAGDVRAAARLMRDIDDNRPSALAELKALYPHTGKAYLLGITGPPGAGKSTLVDQLTAAFRGRGQKVGVVAIDPTSPFTGGAILGDRIRMNRHSLDPGVFIRSLATRGHLGGVSRSTADVVNVLDAMGMDVVIIETVGVGQDEIDIVSMAHSTVVVMVPGLGDDIQAIKAGILEIGDLFVVNKADRDGAERTARDLAMMLEMNETRSGDWRPQVLQAEAQSGRGIDEIVTTLLEHRAYLQESGKLADHQLERISKLFFDLLQERLFSAVHGALQAGGGLQELLAALVRKDRDPYSAVEEILAAQLRGEGR